MAEIALPALYAAFLWWFSTGLVLYLVRLPRHTYPWTLAGTTALAAAALAGLAWSSELTTVTGAFIGFTSALALWAWHEVTFLTGIMTGPRRTACATSCNGWRHFRHAVEAIVWHELAILATVMLVVAVTWGGPNQAGTWSFLVLWLMRISAKLNLFLGVPNLGEEFLPEHFRYLRSFLRRRSMNLLFPLSVTASTLAAAMLFHAVHEPDLAAHEVAASLLAASLLVLAIIEHWFMVLPLPNAALWSWAMGSDGQEPAPESQLTGRFTVDPMPRSAAVNGLRLAPATVRPNRLGTHESGSISRSVAHCPVASLNRRQR